MKVLIIGFGSIGKRHFDILKTLKNIDSIDLVTKQDVTCIDSFASIKNIKNLNIYDYFVIANETYKHFETLKYINSKVFNKKILVEKPLFEKEYNLKLNNKILVAYNLRFHPLISKLKDELVEKILYVNIFVGQYLPTWRKNNYKKSYSAYLSKGGGVLRDLSHEIDYVMWLFGDIINFQYISKKISNLEIRSDDIFLLLGHTQNDCIINLSLDYISKIPTRQIIIHTETKTIKVDLISNSLIINNILQDSIDVDKNHTYRQMHKSILSNELDRVATFENGLKIATFIDKIKVDI